MSEHFTIAELTFSQTAVRKGIDNTPSPEISRNLERLAATLEQVRSLVGGPLTISSGYRCPPLNAAVGGASNSAHRYGLAADITCSLPPKKLAAMIRDSDIEFDQLIYEGTWVHIGLSPIAQPRREVLTATFNNGRVTYSKGIA